MNTTTAANLNGTTIEQLRAIAADLATEYPLAGARLDHAQFIVIARDCERGGSVGTWWVGSEADPTAQYMVLAKANEQPCCTCQDFARRGSQVGACKHILAVYLVERAERLEAEAGDPTPEPPAPASAPVIVTDTDVTGEPIAYELTRKAMAALDEARQRAAATCPECGTWKDHGALYCGGKVCEADRFAHLRPAGAVALICKVVA